MRIITLVHSELRANSSSGARYVPPHRRGRQDRFLPRRVSSSGDEYESNSIDNTTGTSMVASGSKSPVPMFQPDDTFSTPPASPGLMKFEEEQQRSPLHIGTRVRNERMFMNTSLDLENEEEEKEEENNRSSHVLSVFGCTADQGKRDKMEDRHVAILDLNKHLGLSTSKEEEFQSFFGVYDGHSGYEAAEYAAKHIHELLVKEENFESDTLKAFVQCFQQIRIISTREILTSRTEETVLCWYDCIVVLFRGHRCFVATLGDSLWHVDGFENITGTAITHFHEKIIHLEYRYSPRWKAVAISEKCTPERPERNELRKQEVGSRRRRSFCV